MSIGEKKSIIAPLLSTVELELRKVDALGLTQLTQEYLLSLKERIDQLKALFSKFHKTTYGGRGAPSLQSEKLKMLKSWLEKYKAGEGEELDLGTKKSKLQPFDLTELRALSNKVDRIIRIFEQVIPQTYKNIQERVSFVLEEGGFFIENFNSFTLQDGDINTKDLLMADDGIDVDISELGLESLDDQLDNLSSPKKTLAKIGGIVKSYIELFKRTNALVDEMLPLLNYLEDVDFIATMEAANKKNDIILNVFRLLNKIHDSIGRDRKLELLIRDDEFDPEFFEFYRNILERAADLLPAEMSSDIRRRMDEVQTSKLVQKSIGKKRETKYEGPAQEALSDLAKADRTVSAMDRMNLQMLVEAGLSNRRAFF
jgi:hypothetical protein